MMNRIWLIMIVVGLLVAAGSGRAAEISAAITSGGEQAVALSIGLLATLSFWLGLARVAEKSGILNLLARLVSPLLRPLFPSLRCNQEAMQYIVLNFCSNLLGLGNAATPFGLKAMQAMQRANRRPERATDGMCTLLVLNTAGLALLPTTVIALRAASGSSNPTATVGVTLLAGSIATSVGLLVDLVARMVDRGRK
ncbi:MAG: nucleoside recognition domain-containing protein [Bacillota bacterium]|jgi:spore maturation protein A